MDPHSGAESLGSHSFAYSKAFPFPFVCCVILTSDLCACGGDGYGSIPLAERRKVHPHIRSCVARRRRVRAHIRSPGGGKSIVDCVYLIRHVCN